MLGFAKQKLAGALSKFNGNKDFLEAVCAACALVTAADGKVDDDEIDNAIKAISANPTLTTAFSAREIEKTAQAMLNRAQGGRVGLNGLYKEIEEVLKKDATGEMAETVLLSALDVADAGGIDDKEKEVLQKIAGILKLDLKKYL